MNKWAFSFLAMGKEHINEFNETGNRIRELDTDIEIFVGTDSPETIDKRIGANTIKIEQEFNYNLKRIPIGEALKHYDRVWYCDTDTYFRNRNRWNMVNELETGIHPIAILNESQLGDERGSTEYMREYLDWMKTENRHPELILECSFILVHPKGLIREWESIDRETRGIQHQQYELKGASEGLIIWTSAKRVGLPIHPNTLPIWNDIVHSGYQNHKGKPTMI